MGLIKYFFLFLLFILLNVCEGALLEEKLTVEKKELTTSTSTNYHIETSSIKEEFTSPYQSLSQKDLNLLKPIFKTEEKIEEEPRVEPQVIIPYQIKLKFDELKFDEELYHKIQREIEEVARLEKKMLEERKMKIMIEKQKIEKEEKERIKEIKMEIAKEEKEKFEEKMRLIEDEIEEELARRKAKKEEEERIKELAIKKTEEEKEKLIKQKREDERLKKQLKKAKKEKKKEEQREKEEEKLAGHKELDLDKILDRELPLDSKLSINGTKVIEIKAGDGVYLDSKRRKNNEKPPAWSTSGIDINQQLTVKLHGVVKEKIHVNVDYSDIDSNKKKDFSINYQGDKKDMIQKVEFGDVKFSAPGTEFVGYNTQVFGVSGEANVGKKIKLWGIASTSKGIRASKEFKGDKRIVNINRADITYTAQKYYCLLPDEIGTISLPITLEAVYIDDKNGNNNNTPKHIGNAIAKISIPEVGSKTYTGLFDIQYNGEDYVFDSATKIITFKQNVGRDYIVGVVFKDSTGNYFPAEYSGNKNNPNTILMIEPGEAFIEYDVFELKNHYNIGENIPTDTEFKLEIRDNVGRDFFDKNNNTRKDQDEYYYLQVFGLDNDGNGRIDDAPNYDYIDHTNGIITFPDSTPFEIGTGSNPFLKIQPHVDNLKDYFEQISISYNPTDDYSLRHKYTIIGSYTTKVRNYMLGELNIVEGSEEIYVDGKKLKRNTDYFIDYDTGFLTFREHVNITEYTTIKIDYEYTPFIGRTYQKTLAGLRGEFKPNDNLSIGSTYLYEGAPKLNKIPKVSDQVIGNSHVIDVNTSIKVSPLLKNLFNLENNLPVEITISGEIAKSFNNKNTFGSAIIDSMEGVEDSRKIPMDEERWQLGSLPQSNLPRGKLFYCKDRQGNLMISPLSRPISEISGPYDYKENVKWEEDDTIEENVLRLYYQDFGTNSWISIVHPLSKTSLDFTDYTRLEIWFRDQDIEKIDELYIDLGEISEHADGTGTSTREPRSEDISPKDYILNKGEDVGWRFEYPDGVVTKVGADNNQLDTEDLDGDGVLSTKENYYELRFKEFKEIAGIRNKIGDWQLWSIPLSKARTGSGTPRWSDIKHIRLRFKGAGIQTTGEIRIGGIALVGSGRWVIGTITPVSSGTFNISSKNAEDDDYPSIRNHQEYKELYPDEDMKNEETLVLKYELSPASTTGTTTKGYTYRTFYTSQNYNEYKYLRFWLYGDNSGGKFFIRFGIDENNYFGYTLPINFTGWKLIRIDLDAFKDKLIYLIEEGKRTGTKTPPYNYTQLPFGYEAKNNPIFENIKWISVGVENTNTTKSIAGEIYVNDIHLSESQESEGLARKLTLNTKYKDYLSVNLNEKIVDSEFQCIGKAPQNEDTKRQELSIDFSKIKFLPLTYQWYNDIKELDPTKGKNLLSDSCGKTLEKYQKLSTNFKVKEFKDFVKYKYLKKFPDITITTWADRKNVNTARRNKKENEINENLHGDTSYVYNYTFPKKIFKFLPTGESLSLSSTYKHSEDWSKNMYEIETTKNSRILTRNQDENLTLEFTPIKTLKGKSIIIAKQTFKKIHNISQNDEKYYLTSRTLEQTFNEVRYSGIPFVSPRVDTGMKYVETYKGTSAKRTKDINTSAHFALTIEKALNPFEWFSKLKHYPRYKLFTFTPNFTLDVRANYNNISAELGSLECIKNIYNDYYKGQLLKGEGPKTDRYPPFGGDRISASNKRVYAIKSNWYTKWQPLERTLFNYTRTDDKSQEQSSLSHTLTNAYEIDLGISLLKALPRYSRLLSSGPSDNALFNTKYSWTKTEGKQTRIKTDLTSSINWNRKWKEGLNTIFKLDHINSNTNEQGNKKEFKINTTPSFQINYDIEKPKPVKLPFGRKFTLQRTLKTKTILKIEFQKGGKDNNVTSNINAYSVDMDGSYTLQKNITTTLGGKVGYTRDKLEKDKDFYGYEGRVRVEFRF